MEQGKHHVSAVCNIAPILLTRVAACWRNGQRYILRDIDGRQITVAEGRQICADRYTIPDTHQTASASHHHNQTAERQDGPTQSGVDRGRSGNRTRPTPKPTAEPLDLR